MQSFGTPRPTTNPYIVMLRDSLVGSDEIDHVPFSWRTALTGRYDVFHVHWPDTLLDGRSPVTRAGKRAAFAVLLIRLRLRRTPIVRTVHNLAEPEGTAVDRALVSALNRRTALRIRISATTPETAGVPSVLIPHGHYRGWYDGMPKEERVPGRLGYVGLIKAYKGVDSLISAYADARAVDSSLTLDVSGRPADERASVEMRAAEARIPGLTMTLRYVDENEFVTAVTRSSLVVLPYRYMHNSGSALAALSLDRPVLVPANETNRALAEEVGTGWVLLFDGELSADDLQRALTNVVTAPEMAPDLSAREWSTTATHHAHAYRRAIALRSRRGKEPHRAERIVNG